MSMSAVWAAHVVQTLRPRQRLRRTAV